MDQTSAGVIRPYNEGNDDTAVNKEGVTSFTMSITIPGNGTPCGSHKQTLKRKHFQLEAGEDPPQDGFLKQKKVKETKEINTYGDEKLEIVERKLGIPKLMTAMKTRRELKAENLYCDYFPNFYSRKEAYDLQQACEKTLEYFTGELATVKFYGRNIPIPRKQVAHGDDGLTYTYSRVTVPAKPWLPILEDVRKRIEEKTRFKFNFVLINRYKDGQDSIGEHRDDEKDLDRKHPIASLSLGQQRDFVLRHKDARGKKKTREIDPIKIPLEHGSLLMMNYPTNQYWYHSLPRRAAQQGVRINMTFRKILRQTEDEG